MYGMWADPISLLCRQIKRTKRTPEDASSPSLRTAASPLSCIPRKTATQHRPLPPSVLCTARSQIVPQLFRPRYRQHQLRSSSHVQSVTDRTNVPLPPYKAIRHREGERCPQRDSGSVKITCPNSPAFRGGALDSATTIHYSILPPACFDPHFLRIHRIASIPMFVRLSVYPSVPRPESVLPLPPPKHARSLGACPLSCCNGATRSVGHSFYRFLRWGPFAPPSARWRPRNEMPEGLIAFCLAAG